MDLKIFISTIAGIILGGLVTGCFSLKAVKNSYKNQLKLNEENENKAIMGLLHAIHDEIQTVFEIYQKNMGILVESTQGDSGIKYYYPLTSEYFNIYSGNSYLIGRIPDASLRKRIIVTYSLAKGLIDSYLMNNELIKNFELASNLYNETNLKIYQLRAQVHDDELIKYAKSLKIGHYQLKESIEYLFTELKKYGVSN